MPPRFPPPRKPSHMIDPCPDGPVLIIICGPSGCGKTTLVKRLINEFNDCMERSVSHTTRLPRKDEQEGIDYHFITNDKMKEGIENGEYLEHVSYIGQFYGTSKRMVENILNAGKLCVLTIDIFGCEQIKKSSYSTRFLFIRPPNLLTLKDRLKARSGMDEEELLKRFAQSVKEIEYSRQPGNFDEIFVNDNLEMCYMELVDYLQNYIISVRTKMQQASQVITINTVEA